MGGLDQACGAAGIGNVRPGIFSESTGAALVVATMTESVILDPRGELPCYYGIIPGQYMLHAGAKGGIMYRWLRDTLCETELAAEKTGGENAYLLMDRLAVTTPAGSEGLVMLPFFGGCNAYRF
jgi:xylulokinase